MLDAVKGLSKGSLAVALAVGLCGVFVASAPARTLVVRISAPASSVAGAPCRVVVSVSRPIRATVLLQERDGRRWRTVARKRLTRRSVTLRCPSGRAGKTRRFRALNPAQFGVEGTGGPPSPETLALLSTPNVVLDADGVADMQAGRIDPRIVAVLAKLAEAHVLTVSAMCSDHPKFTAGGTISQHYLGRGVDIAAIDGVPVSPANPTALDVALSLSSLEAGYRPDEVGSPFAIPRPGYYTDAGTQDHLHIAFKQPIDPSWTPAS
jgi:hypothetical protein